MTDESEQLNAPPITVGYWTIRGLGAPLRMMVMYSGRKLNAQCFDLKATESGFDGSCWSSEEKVKLKVINPLINLPYIQDGDIVVAQTNACFTYLGRKLGLLGTNDKELNECEQLLCEVMDLRNKMVRFVYENYNTAAKLLVTAKDNHFQKFELWFDKKINSGESDTFLVGNFASAPDFHLWEMLDQYIALAKFYNQECPIVGQFPHLNKFYRSFAELPQNQAYFACKLSELPFNNKLAYFGATTDGNCWPSSSHVYDFGDVSGIY